ncbi:MAG: 2OG-Fe(II) oxygenase [Sulfurimonas sp.]
MYETLYEKIVDGLVNDGYIVLDNALDASLANELLREAKSRDDFKKAGISTKGSRDENRRRDKILWLDEAGSKAEQKYLEFANGLREHINRALFMGIKRYEAHFAKYEAGDFYEKHLDAFKNSKNRVVTTVFYLNDSWSEADDGELVIYDKDDKKLRELLPLQNRLVVFLSEAFAHEVLAAKKERYSIAGWFRVDEVFV